MEVAKKDPGVMAFKRDVVDEVVKGDLTKVELQRSAGDHSRISHCLCHVFDFNVKIIQ